MEIYMNNVKGIILVVIYICSFNGTATEVELLPITYNEHISSFLVSEFVEDVNGARFLDITNIESPKSAEQVLSKYYWLLKNAKFDDAAKLYDVKDGSQSSFINAIKSKQLKLNGFSNLSGVRIDHIQQWSSFSYFWMTFRSNDGQKVSLRQEVFCRVECKLVFNTVGSKSEVDDLIELNLFAYKTLEGQKYSPVTIDKLKRFSKINIKHPKSSDIVHNKFPLTFYLNLDKSQKDIVVSKSNDCKSDFKDKVQLSVCHFLNKFEIIDTLDSDALSKFISEIRGEPNADPISLNSYSGNRIKKIFYQSKTFVHWVKSWSSIKLVGSIENEFTFFLFFKPMFDDGREDPIQIVTFDKIGDPSFSKTIYGNNGEDTYDYFQNSLFITELSSVINE